jgi:cell division protein FtsQ
VNTAIDQRLVRRRRAVTEDGARRRLRLLLVVIALVTAGSIGAWMLYHWSYLSVGEIAISGRAQSRAAEILDEEGVAVGVPTVRLRAGAIEDALLRDPWIAAVDVRVSWPGSLTVDILERAPVAWVDAGDVWMLTAASGIVLDTSDHATADFPSVALGGSAVEPGHVVDGASAAAVEFMGALPRETRAGAVVAGAPDDVVAQIRGYEVALGYPTDMLEKAAALLALLDGGVEQGAVINLVSPSRPAVTPQVVVDTSPEVIGDSQPSG